MGIGGIGGVNGISGIGRMQDYSIQMSQPAKTVIVEETGADSHVASSEQINSGNSTAAKEEVPVGEQKPNAPLEDISITFHIQGMDIAVPANVAEIVLFVERNGDVL